MVYNHDYSTSVNLKIGHHFFYCVCFYYFRVNITVKRVGGGYGAKLFRAGHVAAACALGAYVTGRYCMLEQPQIQLSTYM